MLIDFKRKSQKRKIMCYGAGNPSKTKRADIVRQTQRQPLTINLPVKG
jgi:hypothetical protein